MIKLNNFLDILQSLDITPIYMDSEPNCKSILICKPGHRIEIDFWDDGKVEWELFTSDGIRKWNGKEIIKLLC